VGTNPFRETFATQRRRSELQDRRFLFIDGRQDFGAIENQKHFHRGVSNPLIAVNKWMV